MSSIDSRSVALLVAIMPVSACYSPHSSSVSTGDDAEASDSTSVPSTSSGGDPSTTDLSTTTETGGSDGADSTTADHPVCGDATVEGDEVCDDGVNDGSYGGCVAGCGELGPHCGDGIEQGDEACDDGEQTNGDGCNIDCVVSGTVLWTHIVDGPANLHDDGRSVAIGDDDAAYVVAVVDDQAGTLIRKYDSAGVEDWTETFEGPGNGGSVPSEADWSAELELLVVGTHDAEILGNADDGWMRGYTSSGRPAGSLSWDNPSHSNDAASGIAVNDVGQQFVLGQAYRVDLGQSWNIWLTKLDAGGDEMWTQTFDGGGSDVAASVAVDGEGNAVAVGSTTVEGEGRNIWVRKYATEGAVLWTRSYSSAENCGDDANDVAIDTEGNVLVAAESCGEAFVRKYTPDGSIAWTDVYSDPDSLTTFGAGVAADSEGNVVLVGMQWINYHQDIWIRKYSPDGQESWTYEHAPDEAQLFSEAAAVGIDSTDAIVVVGSTQDVDTDEGSDIWVQKFAP